MNPEQPDGSVWANVFAIVSEAHSFMHGRKWLPCRIGDRLRLIPQRRPARIGVMTRCLRALMCYHAHGRRSRFDSCRADEWVGRGVRVHLGLAFRWTSLR